MQKIKIDQLDIPIIRACNLACKGCITHSDHKKIKGTVKLDESLDWLKFWESKLDPVSVTLFGGEPLLHPDFVAWAQSTRKIFGYKKLLKVNTNGYYLETLYDHVAELFDARMETTKNPDNAGISLVVSVQTGIEPYLSKVHQSIDILKEKIADYHRTLPGVKTVEWNLWLDEYDTNFKRWYELKINGHGTTIHIAICDQYKLPWCTHYQGTGPEMEPCYNYNDVWYTDNHKFCQAKDFVTLYNGNIYKCPPIGVLGHTLDTFRINDRADWAPYINNYQALSTNSSDEEIAHWIERQKQPEQVCNMCAFAGPKNVKITSEDRSHYLKNHWKYTV
jgi:organic radical activating enzyme